MKLASLRSGRDGRLVVVNRSLTQAAYSPILTMQEALDDWEDVAPQLARLAADLESGTVESFVFRPSACAAPLPRSHQWLDGSAYVNHVELVRRSRGESLPDWYYSEPLLYQGGSDIMLGASDPIRIASDTYGIDFEGEVAVILGDVPAGADDMVSRSSIRLVALANDVSLRNLIPSELKKGFGFMQSKPATAFSPVAVTPDELGNAWDGRRVSLPLISELNGARFGAVDAGPEMHFDFPTLIRHATKTRALGAGTILGSGTVSNRGMDGGPGLPIAEGGRGYSCISEQRMAEIIRTGEARTPYLAEGDRVRIEMCTPDGLSIFGSIDQRLELAHQQAFR
jgi:fumarylacetoacetate (FAA) hydrolase